MRILIVDDEPLVLSCFESILSQRHEVRTAPSLKAALAILGEGFAPEAVIADYALGNNTTGLELLSEVRRLCPDSRRYLISGDVGQIPANRDPGLVLDVIPKGGADDAMLNFLQNL